MSSNVWASLSDRRVIGLIVIAVLFCLVDFVQRVQPAIDTAALSREVTVTEMSAGPTEYVVSERVQTWLASLTTVAGEAGATGPETVQQALLTGGTDIGEKRVRVRAILIANSTQQKVALIEAQDRDQRDVEFVELRQGDTLSGYTISAVRVDGVEFVPNSGDSAPVFVKVFE